MFFHARVVNHHGKLIGRGISVTRYNEIAEIATRNKSLRTNCHKSDRLTVRDTRNRQLRGVSGTFPDATTSTGIQRFVIPSVRRSRAQHILLP